MTEAFLHYVWKFRLFTPHDLKTTEGTSVEVVRPGHHNTDAGPDFFNAQIRVDGTLWAGNVELHLRASDWQKHSHHLDDAYDNCILHVVLDADSPTLRKDGSVIPAIELKNRIPHYLWDNYIQLLSKNTWVPCQNRIHEIDELTIRGLLDRLAVERLEYKTTQISRTLEANKDDWEETFYLHLARNFGFHVNAIPFELLARSLPFKLIRKYNDRLIQTEALLYGQAGLLNKDFSDGYPLQLKDEYKHLSELHNLKPIHAAGWKFLRLRPNNFPTIRIAQFANILFSNKNLFSRFLEMDQLEDLFSYFESPVSDYWHTHFMFDKPSIYSQKIFGSKSAENIIINTVIPFLFAWGTKRGEENYRHRAIDFLEKISPEDNQVIRKWKETGIQAISAFHSQALIHLKVHHCSEKKCLSCLVGNRLINAHP